MAHLEKVRGVVPSKRALTPLFVNFAGYAFRHQNITDIFKSLLSLVLDDPEQVKRYSMHSWRIYLACALLEAGASDGTIQTMLRWRSDEALRIYARINDSKYADWLVQASQAKVSSVRTTTLADHMAKSGVVGGIHQAAFSDAWLRQAAKATVTETSKANIPEVDDSAMYANLNSGFRALMAAAEKEDEA